MPNNITQIKQLANLLKSSSNPQQLISNLVNQNPQMRQVLNMLQSSGKSPRDLFYELAKQKGVDPNQIINMLNQ